MKVLVLSEKSDLPEIHLYVGLKRLGVDISLMGNPSSIHENILSKNRIKVTHWSYPTRIHFPSIKKIRQALRNGFEILHYTNSHALSCGLIASLGFNVKHVAYRGTSGHLSWFDPTSLLTYLNPRLSRIICVSDAVKNYMQSLGISENKCIRIYKGHSSEWYHNLPDVPLSEFGIPPNAFVVSCTANMRPVKGVDLLIKAFEELDPSLSIHLLLIGNSKDPSVINALNKIRAKDRVHLTGFRPDAPAIVKNTHVFVMPSREREGLPKAAIEAMVQGVPAIVTSVGGMPELVRQGHSGLVVPPNSPRSISEAIINLKNNEGLRRTLGENAARRINDHFSIEQTIVETKELYDNLICG